MITNDNYEYIEKDLIDRNLICELCQDPLVDPFVTPCRHTFCHQCIEQHLKRHSSCPTRVCKKSLCIDDVNQHEPGIVLAMLNRLKVKCTLCQETDLCRGDFDKHIDTVCTKTIVECASNKIGCQWTGPRNELDNHLQTCLLEKVRPSFETVHDELQQQSSHIKQLETQVNQQKIQLEHMAQKKIELEKRMAQLEERMDQPKPQLEAQMAQLKIEPEQRTVQQKTEPEGPTDQQNIKLQQVQNRSQRQNKEAARIDEEIKLPKNKRQRQSCLPNIHRNAKWIQNGITIAGGNGCDGALNQPCTPYGLYMDENQTLYVTYWENHCVVEWKLEANEGRIVAGGNGHGDRPDQLYRPTDVIVDQETNSIIVCDTKRIVRWSRENDTKSGEVIITDINCCGLAMDDEGFLYVSDYRKNEVRRYAIGDTQGTRVAGGKGQGNGLNQLNRPSYLFIDRDHSVYVSDSDNHRVMKWMKGAEEGTIVAGGRGAGSDLTQLNGPRGVFVDLLGTVYAADYWNNRIMRWLKGATQGEVIAGGNGGENQANQLNCPTGLLLDRQGNLYVADYENHRVQQFLIEGTN